MARSNPGKRKRREAKRTLLFYCEGSDEKVFLEYLKLKFAKNSGWAVTIKENKGGSPNDILENCLKQPIADLIYCCYDLDREVNEDLKKRAFSKGVKIIENKPCLESFLLEVLEGKNYSHCKSEECKKIFEDKYLDSKKRKDKRNYFKIFPKEFLKKQSAKNKKLKRLIDLISGKS